MGHGVEDLFLAHAWALGDHAKNHLSADLFSVLRQLDIRLALSRLFLLLLGNRVQLSTQLTAVFDQLTIHLKRGFNLGHNCCGV